MPFDPPNVYGIREIINGWKDNWKDNWKKEKEYIFSGGGRYIIWCDKNKKQCIMVKTVLLNTPNFPDARTQILYAERHHEPFEIFLEHISGRAEVFKTFDNWDDAVKYAKNWMMRN